MADAARIPVDPSTGEPLPAAPKRVAVDPNTGEPLASAPARIPVNPDTGAPLGQKTAAAAKGAPKPPPKPGDFGWLQPVADWWKKSGLNQYGEPTIRPTVGQLPGYTPHARGVRPTTGDPTGGLLTMLDEGADDMTDVVNRNLRSLAKDVTKPLDAKKGVMAAPARAGKTALDTAMAIATPVEAVYRMGIGRPVESWTKGAVKSEDAAGAAMLTEGGVQLVKAAPKIIRAIPKLQEGLVNAGRAIKAAAAPSTVSASSRATAKAIRGIGARNQLQADQAANTLLKMDRTAAQMSRRDPGYYRKVINFIENRSKPYEATKSSAGGTLGQLHEMGLSSTDKPLVDSIRDINQGYREKAEEVIAKNKGAAPRFVTDYYAHMWQEPPDKVEQALARAEAAKGAPRQGSGRNFKARSIPTIEDGIAAGLTPKYANPIETTLVYAQNMSNFLATHETQAWLKANDYGKWFRPGQQPAGWVPLQGILTEREPVMTGRTTKPSSFKDEPAPLRLPGRGQLEGPAGGAQAALPPPRDPNAPLVGEVLPPEGTAPQGQLPGEGTKQIGGPTIENITPKAETPKPDRADRGVDKEQLYAPEDVARVYNNWISKSLIDSSAMGKGFDMLSRASNTGKALKFGLSGYHALTMGWEGAISQVARGIQSAARGRPLTAARQIATAPAGAVTSGLRGARMQRQLLEPLLHPATPAEAKINDLFVNSGGRMTMDKLYRTTESRNFYNNMKTGSLRSAVNEAVQNMYGKDRTVLGRVKAHADLVANISGSLTAPLFEDIIPAIKRGAFAERMSDWLTQNPDATDEQALDFATKLNDSIDNRFGEMVTDNMFWNRRAKQIAQMALLSSSWTIGTAREIGGGLADVIPSARALLQGKGISDRTAYVAALAATVATADAVATYLKTGEGPKDVQDLEAYRTGGEDTRLGHAPERGIFPGYQKDVYAAIDAAQPGSGGYLGMLRSKLDPTASLALDMATNTDYAGHRLYGAGARSGALVDRIADAYNPFALDSALKGKLRGSNISPVEQILGVKPAPLSVTNPEGLRRLRESQMRREKKTAEKSQRRQDSRRAKDDPTTEYLQ